jgi:DNA-binding transcriptional MerR regulator
MRLSIGSLSKRSGVSIRALHHYDQIGLLQPSEVAESGYRYYDDAAIERLWQILFYRELGFPLGDIGEILSSPAFDRNRALTEHRSLLVQKRERLDRLIDLVSNAMKGANKMEFKPFDTSEIDALREQYAAEAKARWGDTQAYRESTKRAAQWTEADKAKLQKESDKIFAAFAALVGTDPAHAQVQALVSRWKAFVSESYYDCTDEILAGLGQMYIADERFAKNIDKFGAGTAQLMSEAIAVYCKK